MQRRKRDENCAEQLICIPAITSDSAVGINDCSDQGASWRSEGTEANNFNAVYGAWPWAGDFFKRPLKRWRLQATITTNLFAFVPEGSFLDGCVIP